MTIPSNDLLEFIDLLNQKKARYLIVGGWAVAFNGMPRYTKDIDILIDPSKTNALILLEALEDFGFGSLGITVEDLTNAGQIIQLGYEPNRIDILTSIPAVNFNEAWENSLTITKKHVTVRYISPEFLLRNKKSVARPQDLVDAAFLEKKIKAKK